MSKMFLACFLSSLYLGFSFQNSVHAFTRIDSSGVNNYRHRQSITRLYESTPEREHLVSLDPDSDEAYNLIVDKWGQTEDIYKKLSSLSHLVTEWNDRINLVSRQDCNPSTVFGRHVLPCVSATQLELKLKLDVLSSAERIIDVGTGGGFPGIPLAILYSDKSVTLLDSVGKKLIACGDMAEALGLMNVRTHHGRAEELTNAKFNVVVGRSVAAIPQFCAWVYDLLEEDGHLLYWIGGGDIPEEVLDLAEVDEPIQNLNPALKSSDKRILVFPAAAVKQIAKESGLMRTKKTIGKKIKAKIKPQRKEKSKGEWRSKERNQPKQRGYDSFKRFSSTSRLS